VLEKPVFKPLWYHLRAVTFPRQLNTQMSNQNSHEPTPFQILASVIRGTGKTTLKSSTVAFSARLPEYLLAKVDAAGTMAGKSRNAMLIHLLDSCFEQLGDLFDPATNKRFEELTAENFATLTGQKADAEPFEG
jgi:hypothetical protein